MSAQRVLAVIAVIVVAAAFVVPTASAWDNHRKGFVAGLGAGFAPAAHLSRDYLDYSSTETGFAGQVLLGYAFTDQLLLAYDANVAFVRPEYIDTYSLPGVRCLSVYYYPGAVGRTFFMAAGVGRMLSQGTKFNGGAGTGWGYELGVGYELLPHVQFGAFYHGGSTTDNGFTSRDDVFNILVTVVGY